MTKADQATSNLECPGPWVWVGGIEDGGLERGHHGLYLHHLPSDPYPGGRRRGGGKEERGGKEEEEETYILQFAVIKLCKFAVIQENLSIFAVIRKNVAAITPLGDFDMRPHRCEFLSCLYHLDFFCGQNIESQTLGHVCTKFHELCAFLGHLKGGQCRVSRTNMLQFWVST